MTTIRDEYERRRLIPSDINEHMPQLMWLAEQCRHVTEFGVRSGNSTVAFLAGLVGNGGMLHSYDRDDCIGAIDDNVNYEPATWVFDMHDTGAMPLIAPTDMLFIDTLHDAAHVSKELRQAWAVKKYLVFHDTVLFGSADESTGQPPGIMHAILDFMTTDAAWRVGEHSFNNCGLLVLQRR